MKLYICIYNKVTKEIQYPEEWPIDTEEEKEWAGRQSNRMALQCALYGGTDWVNYFSEKEQFAWPVE